MELLRFDEFSQLRLAQFHPDPSRIVALENWEFMGTRWVGEADGFTAFLRPEHRPDELGSIEIDLGDFQEQAAVGILNAVRLPLRTGMTFKEVVGVFGEPNDTQEFVADNWSHNFTIRDEDRYYVSCTIHEGDGLIFVAIIRSDILPKV